MDRTRRPRIIVGVAAAAALILIGAACAPQAPPPPPPPPAAPSPSPSPAGLTNPGPNGCSGSAGSGSGTGSGVGSDTLAPAEAAVDAVETYEAEADAPTDTVAIVTVEDTADGPNIETHIVDSAGEAAAVAVHEAQGDDLIAVETDEIATTTASNDPYRPAQWGLDASPFESAWGSSNGTGVTVAVIDTGVNASHGDLAGQIYQGWTFLAGTSQLGAPDGNGHGTHVSGTIAAHAGNGIGVTGAAPGAKVLPVRVLGSNGSGYYSDVAQGIVWAAQHGARVINLSLGGPSSSISLDSAVDYARGCGAVVVAAAGNDGNCAAGPNGNSYPAASPGAIGVASIRSNLQRSCFSNVGSYVDIAGPGSGIWSTTSNGGYASWSGTSMATPHVAAAAAIVVGSHPSCSAAGAEARILDGASPLGAPATHVGSGLVNPLQSAQIGGC